MKRAREREKRTDKAHDIA